MTRPMTDVVSRWWAAPLGLVVAVVQLVLEAARESLAVTVVAAALCYLAAAAWGRPWIAWVTIPAVVPVVVAAELLSLPWWTALSAVGGAVFLVGVRLRAVPAATLRRQAVAMAGFTALAIAALALSPDAGLVLAGLALAGHGIWDAVHLRTRTVVPRSLAYACLWLDVPLGLGAIALSVA